jgi:hypothetical protein
VSDTTKGPEQSGPDTCDGVRDLVRYYADDAFRARCFAMLPPDVQARAAIVLARRNPMP